MIRLSDVGHHSSNLSARHRGRRVHGVRSIKDAGCPVFGLTEGRNCLARPEMRSMSCSRDQDVIVTSRIRVDRHWYAVR